MIVVAILMILLGLLMTLNHDKPTRIFGFIVAFVGLFIGLASSG